VAEQRYNKYKAQGFEAYFVVAETGNYGQKADAAVCAAIRDEYGLTMPVLFDPDNLLGKAYGWATSPPNERNIVFGPGAQIVFIGHYTSQSTIEELIVTELAQ
jgi:hypothetical protein